MKKVIGMLMIILLVLGFSACKDTTQQENPGNSSKDEASEEKEESINLEGILDSEGSLDPEGLVDPQGLTDTAELVDSIEINENIKYGIVTAYMEEECRKAFSPSYRLMDYQISDYHQFVENGKVNASYTYTLFYRNDDEDLEPKEMHFNLKAIFGNNDSITLYSRISPNGLEWEKTRLTDFILE